MLLSHFDARYILSNRRREMAYHPQPNCTEAFKSSAAFDAHMTMSWWAGLISDT